MSPIQVTERSHSEKRNSSLQKRTVPLPLEVVFQPDVRGVYNPRKPSLNDDSLVEFEFEPRPGFRSDESVEDAWFMREAFLQSRWLAAGLDAVTLRFGRFGQGREDISVASVKLPASWKNLHAGGLLDDEFLEWQSLIRAAMETRMSTWPTLRGKFPAHKVNLLCQPMQLAVEWQDGRPMGIIRCSGILQALIATLQIDALMNAEYRFCACVGCGKSFKVTRKDQRYCPDSDCKHRQVVRDGRERERQRKAAQQGEGPNPEMKSK